MVFNGLETRTAPLTSNDWTRVYVEIMTT